MNPLALAAAKSTCTPSSHKPHRRNKTNETPNTTQFPLSPLQPEQSTKTTQQQRHTSKQPISTLSLSLFLSSSIQMGCNESKSSNVATDNTTTRRHTPLRKQSTKRANTINDNNNNNNNPLESIPGTGHANADVKGSSPVKGPEADNAEKVSPAGVHADVKEVVVNNKAEDEEGAVVEGTTTTAGKKAGKLTLKESPERYCSLRKDEDAGKKAGKESPERHFSSRKDEDGVESVVTEEGYYSPNHESVKDVETREEHGEPEEPEPEPEMAVKVEENLLGGLVEEKRTEVAIEEKLVVDQVVEPEVIFKEAGVILPSAEPNEGTKIEDKQAVVVTEAPYGSLQAKEQDAAE